MFKILWSGLRELSLHTPPTPLSNLIDGHEKQNGPPHSLLSPYTPPFPLPPLHTNHAIETAWVTVLTGFPTMSIANYFLTSGDAFWHLTSHRHLFHGVWDHLAIIWAYTPTDDSNGLLLGAVNHSYCGRTTLERLKHTIVSTPELRVTSHSLHDTWSCR